jgi:hypothetical protein
MGATAGLPSSAVLLTKAALLGFFSSGTQFLKPLI